MRIELEENEIKDAIIQYVSNQGLPINVDGSEVDLKNARGEFGVTATISVSRTGGTEPQELKVAATSMDEDDGDEDNASIFATGT